MSREGKKTPPPDRPLRAVVFHTYPKMIFVWPLIAAGYLFWAISGLANLEVLGWLYLGVLCLVLLTMGIDLHRDHAFFWLVVFLGFFFLGRWLADAKGFTLFGNVYRWFADRDVTYSVGFGASLSILLTPPYLAMLVWARLQHKWRITHNEFEHYSWGRADDSLARGAKRVRSTYPDLLELLLAGSGTLIVYSATGRSELRRIPHVPLIFLVRKRINRLLESTEVVARSRQQEELLESEEAAAEEAEASPAGEPESGGIGSNDPL